MCAGIEHASLQRCSGSCDVFRHRDRPSLRNPLLGILPPAGQTVLRLWINDVIHAVRIIPEYYATSHVVLGSVLGHVACYATRNSTLRAVQHAICGWHDGAASRPSVLLLTTAEPYADCIQFNLCGGASPVTSTSLEARPPVDRRLSVARGSKITKECSP